MAERANPGLPVHPSLSLDWHDDEFKMYVHVKMTEKEYLDALEGNIYIPNSWNLKAIIEEDRFNTVETNAKLNMEKFTHQVGNLELGNHYISDIKISAEKLKEYIDEPHSKDIVNALYHPDIPYTDSVQPAALSEAFLRNGDDYNFIKSVQALPPESVGAYADIAATKIRAGSKLTRDEWKIMPQDALKVITNNVTPEVAYDLAIMTAHPAVFKGLPPAIQERVANDWLGISGGKPRETHNWDGQELGEDQNWRNWREGDHHSSTQINYLIKNHKLTDAQAEHIMRHGTDDQKYDMFREGKINPEIKTRMYAKWTGNDYGHGYDEDDYRDKFWRDIRDNGNFWEDDDIRDEAREKAEDQYPFDEFLRDIDHGLWDSLDEDVDKARKAVIDKHFEGDEDTASEQYSEANSELESQYMGDLAHTKYRDNALEDTEHLPDDMVNHESFAPHAEAIEHKKTMAKLSEAQRKELSEADFHNARIPQRESTHEYGLDQHQFEMARDMAAARGGSIDFGTLNKAHPVLKDTWKRLFGDKGKLNATDIQAKIDAIPKTPFNISYGKWGGNQMQNLNGQDETIFRLDHSDHSLNLVRAAGQEELFNKIAHMSQRSGHPTNPRTVGWARVDTTDPKHWIIDEAQTDYSKTVRQFLASNDKKEEAEGIDKIMEIQGPWHEALLNHIIKTAKKNGVDKISSHTPESKATHTGAENIHTVYKESYGVMPRYGFQKVDSTTLPLTKMGHANINNTETVNPTQRAHDHYLGAVAHMANAHLHMQEVEANKDQIAEMSLIQRGAIHLAGKASLEMAKKHKEAGLKANPNDPSLKTLEIKPDFSPLLYLPEGAARFQTADVDKHLSSQKPKANKMQTLDLNPQAAQLPAVKKSTGLFKTLAQLADALGKKNPAAAARIRKAMSVKRGRSAVKVKEKMAKADGLQKDAPKSHFESLNVKAGLHRARQVRDLLQEKGGQLPKRELEKLGFNLKALGLDKLVSPQGLLTYDAVKQHIDSAPGIQYNISHDSYGEINSYSDDWDDYPREAYNKAYDQETDKAYEEWYPTLEGLDPKDVYGQLDTKEMASYRRFFAEQEGMTPLPKDASVPEVARREEMIDALIEASSNRERAKHIWEWFTETPEGESKRDELESTERDDHQPEVEVGSPSDYDHVREHGIASRDRSEYSSAEDEQRHSVDLSEVFQLNLHPNQITELKDKDLWGTFQTLWKMSHHSNHPVGPNGIGWVRYTQDHDGIHVDEIQSDFGQSLVGIIKETKSRAQRDPAFAQQELMPGVKVEDFLTNVTPDAVKNISHVVFGGHHPSQILMDGFMEHIRTSDPKAATLPIHIWQQNPKAKLANQEIPDEHEGYSLKAWNALRPEARQKITDIYKKKTLRGINTGGHKLQESRLLQHERIEWETMRDKNDEWRKAVRQGPVNGPHPEGVTDLDFSDWLRDFQPEHWKQENADIHKLYTPENFHDWGKKRGLANQKFYEHKGTGEILGADADLPETGRELPVHMQETYNKIPRGMGFQDSEYGKLETQHNPGLKAEPTFADKVRKAKRPNLAKLLDKVKEGRGDLQKDKEAPAAAVLDKTSDDIIDIPDSEILRSSSRRWK